MDEKPGTDSGQLEDRIRGALAQRDADLAPLAERRIASRLGLRPRRNRRQLWLSSAAAALLVVLLLGILIIGSLIGTATHPPITTPAPTVITSPSAERWPAFRHVSRASAALAGGQPAS